MPSEECLVGGDVLLPGKSGKMNKDGGMRPFIPKQDQLNCICPPAVNRVPRLLWPVYKW